MRPAIELRQGEREPDQIVALKLLWHALAPALRRPSSCRRITQQSPMRLSRIPGTICAVEVRCFDVVVTRFSSWYSPPTANSWRRQAAVVKGHTMRLPRLRLTLSLRGLMILVLVFGGVLGWKARRVSIQRRAVAAIRRAGGLVTYDYHVAAEGTSNPNPQPWAPGWLRRVAGDEWFQEVIVVSLFDGPFLVETQVKEDLVPAVATLDRLEGLEISLYSLTPAGLAPLIELPRLKELHIRLHGPDPGPSDLAPLAKMRHLESLAVETSPEDGACLAHLRGLTGLRSLYLANTRPKDSDLAHLAGMTRLESLSLDFSRINGAGLVHLAGMKSLAKLDLDKCGPLSDAATVHLSGLTAAYEPEPSEIQTHRRRRGQSPRAHESPPTQPRFDQDNQRTAWPNWPA